MNIIFFNIALFMYFIASVHCAIALLKTSTTITRTLTIMTIIGFLSHTAAIVTRYIEAGHIPITNLHEATSFFSWSIVFVFLIIETRYRIGLLGPFILPVAFIFMFSSSMLPKEIKPLLPALESFWLGIHVVFAFLGDASFAIAFSVGIMYLLQERQLKRKKIGSLFKRMPSLEVLDEINYRVISIGFPLLTIGIITGSIWADTAWGSYWNWDPKEVWSLITWIIYALIIHARLRAGWRGRKAAILSIIGFMSVLFTFLGVNLILKGLHVFD
ncbi:MAG: c-type cytochrome biogenesis protein CcsB [Nitrospirota bacterium]